MLYPAELRDHALYIDASRAFANPAPRPARSGRPPSSGDVIGDGTHCAGSALSASFTQ
jgi:hypothetical protein